MVDVTRTRDEWGLWRRPGAEAARPRTGYAPPSVERPARERATATTAALESASGRVLSVDALRGFAMFFIIAGDALAWSLHDMSVGKEGVLSAAAQFLSLQLQHADWEGFRFYDLLFPLFLFVIGISIVFSLSRLVERDGMWAAHERVLRRSFLLFVLGLIYYGGASTLWPDIRLLGVLQRIALCYLFASLMFLHLGLRGLSIAFAALLVGYWALMTFVPIPEVGAGVLAKDANLARWIDAQYLPGLRFYGDWDPEGLLSTLPAIATCLLGVLTGLLLNDRRVAQTDKAWWLIGGGGVLLAAGHVWGLQFPIIKMIWTSSFVLVAGGYSLLLLGVFYMLIDTLGRTAWTTVFLWFGANAIALYMINNLMEFKAVARRLAAGDLERFIDATVTTGAGAFVIVVVGIVLATLLARFLYNRKIFLRV
jgi:predicted acyltransferase